MGEEELKTHHVDPETNINYPVMAQPGIKYVEQATLADISQVLELYEFAESLYPYSNLRLAHDRNPHAARKSDLVLDYMINQKPRLQIGWFFLGAAAFAIWNKKPVLNSLTYSRNPLGTMAWGLSFFTGSYFLRSLLMRVHDKEIKENLLENRRTHGYLKTLKRNIEFRNEIPMDSLS